MEKLYRVNWETFVLHCVKCFSTSEFLFLFCRRNFVVSKFFFLVWSSFMKISMSSPPASRNEQVDEHQDTNENDHQLIPTGDAIGDTVYSRSWLLGVLLKTVQVCVF